MEATVLSGENTTCCCPIDISRLQRAHLVGVAGSGMRALADVLAGWGWHVSGSDCSVPAVQSPLPLEKTGRLFYGHAAEHVSHEIELVIYSDAVPADNPELRRAAELGIPTLSYFQMLGGLSADRHTVAIAGTHGKSTTTALVAHVLVEAGRDPTVFCGATPLGRTSGGRAGHRSRHTPCAVRPVVDALRPPSDAPHQRHTECACYNRPMLIEACEYRANFLKLRPTHAAILGIEPDHFDCYDSLAQLENAFQQFAASLPSKGLLLVRHDCVSTRRATIGLPCRIESFGLCPEADWSARELNIKPRPVVAPPSGAVLPGATTGRGFMEQGRFQFEIRRFGQPFCEVRLQMPGRHNVLNALAAAALAWANGATAEQIGTGLSGFAGLHRRLEVLGTWRDVTMVDDYAHHPTEVTAALAAIREMFPRRRVWCVFQPHQAGRTARLLDELAASLQNADKVLVAEIFRAREGDPRPGEVTAADLARKTGQLGVEVLPVHTAEEIVGTLETHLVPGDVLVTLGAGDVARLRPEMGGEGRGAGDEGSAGHRMSS